MQNQNDYTPFWANWYRNWRPHDVVLSVLLLGMTIVMLVVATATMYSTLINSGEIAFLENPFLAMALSCLSAAASVTLKALPEGFDYKQSKDLYYKVLYSLTVLAIVVWIYQFSITVDGMGAALDIDGMLDGSDSSAYTFSQLIAEILMGASLYSAWQNLHDSYTPKKQKNNPLIPVLDMEINELEHQLHAFSEDISTHLTNTAHLRAKRQSFINRQLESLSTLKANYHDLNDLFGDTK